MNSTQNLFIAQQKKFLLEEVFQSSAKAIYRHKTPISLFILL